MRFWWAFGLLCLAAAFSAVIAVFMTVTAHAQTCRPTAAIKAQASAVGIADKDIKYLWGAESINAYTKTLGVQIPEGSQPIGLLIIEFPLVAYVGIIEVNECIRFAASLPIDSHKAAMAAVTRGA